MSSSFLQRLAQPRPDPGGGAAAAYSAGVGLALLLKVIRLEKARPLPEGFPPTFWSHHLAAARRSEKALARLRQADVEAYAAMVQALSSRDKGPGLKAAVEEALHCPLEIMTEALAILHQVAAVGEHCQAHLLSDLLVAMEILGGALLGAGHIAQANLPLLNSPALKEEWAAQIAQRLHQGLEATLKGRSRLLARAHAGSG